MNELETFLQQNQAQEPEKPNDKLLKSINAIFGVWGGAEIGPDLVKFLIRKKPGPGLTALSRIAMGAGGAYAGWNF
jgi:hypothetical protein